MSSLYDYLPNSIDTPGLRARAGPNSFYNHLTGMIGSMGKGALCAVEVGEDFRKRQDGKSVHYGFVNKEGKVFSANIFGEVVGSAHGTALGAAGTHYWGRDSGNLIPITDSSKVKHQVVLGVPSFATEAVADLFHDQIVTVSNVRSKDMDEEDGPVNAKEAVKSSTGEGDPDLLVLTMGQIYTTTREEGKGKNKETTPKRMMKKRKAGQMDAPDETSASQQAAPDLSRLLDASQLPPASAVRVGAEYPPNVFPDYGRPGFRHRLAKAKQPAVYNERGQLIPLWTFFDALRVGTLLMANVNIQVWVIQNDNNVVRKVYHLIVCSLRVVARSDIAVTKPVPSLLAGNAPDSQEDVVRDEASAALQSLVIPGFDLLDGTAFGAIPDLEPSSPAVSASTMSSSSPVPVVAPEFVTGSSTGAGTMAGGAVNVSQDYDMIDDQSMLGEPDDNELQAADNSRPKKKSKSKRV
ncbi:hypothetical protein AAF712_011022 [Marasmius tenuissimus]|uniref:Uncharacterized protein n=1 Tax=Marasmius tenuissimus TaxID=585030 RepID=A0ABR2ZLB2_9AGAR